MFLDTRFHHHLCNYLALGTGYATKKDEFSELFQTAFNPPPNFWRIMLQFFTKNPCLEPLKLFYIGYVSLKSISGYILFCDYPEHQAWSNGKEYLWRLL